MDHKTRCQEQGINDGIPSRSSSWRILRELTNLRRDVGICVASMRNLVPMKTMKHILEQTGISQACEQHWRCWSGSCSSMFRNPHQVIDMTDKKRGWPAYMRPFSFRGIAVGTCRDKCRLWQKNAREKPWQTGLHRWSTQQLSGYNRCKLSAHLWRSIENARKRSPCARGWGNRVGLLHLWLKPKSTCMKQLPKH